MCPTEGNIRFHHVPSCSPPQGASPLPPSFRGGASRHDGDPPRLGGGQQRGGPPALGTLAAARAVASPAPCALRYERPRRLPVTPALHAGGQTGEGIRGGGTAGTDSDDPLPTPPLPSPRSHPPPRPLPLSFLELLHSFRGPPRAQPHHTPLPPQLGPTRRGTPLLPPAKRPSWLACLAACSWPPLLRR